MGSNRERAFAATLEWLYVRELTVDHRYQRVLRANRVQRLVKRWDDDKVDALLVSRRENGKQLLLNGQHRHAAMMALGWEDRKVPCLVHTGLSLEQEAEIFGNGANDTLGMKAEDKFRARLRAKDPVALGVQGAVAAAGCELNLEHRGGPAAVHCCQACERIYVHHGEILLTDTLKLCREAWVSKDQMAFHREVVAGVATFLSWFQEDPAYTRKRFLKVLSRTTPQVLIRNMLMKRQAEGNTGRLGRGAVSGWAMAQLLHIAYNMRLAEGRQLYSWEEQVADIRRKQADKGLAAAHEARRARRTAEAPQQGALPMAARGPNGEASQ
jgi:hypothetical protein